MSTSHAERVTLKVREVMGARHQSALGLAELTDRSREYMRRRVIGAVPWSIGDLEAIAPHLDVSLDELLAGSDLPPISRSDTSTPTDAAETAVTS